VWRILELRKGHFGILQTRASLNNRKTVGLRNWAGPNEQWPRLASNRPCSHSSPTKAREPMPRCIPARPADRRQRAGPWSPSSPSSTCKSNRWPKFSPFHCFSPPQDNPPPHSQSALLPLVDSSHLGNPLNCAVVLPQGLPSSTAYFVLHAGSCKHHPPLMVSNCPLCFSPPT
jgi:hypothetical protein